MNAMQDPGDMLNFDPPTRSPNDAIKLHASALEKYTYVCNKVRAEMPSLKEIYLSKLKVDCAPDKLGVMVLFANFNELRSTNFVAHPSLNITQNSLIFHYAIDKAHSFSVGLDQSRINIVLAIFVWASRIMNKDVAKYEPSYALWFSLIRAWIEAIVPGESFRARSIFMDAWTVSWHDLTWFAGGYKGEIQNLMKILADGVVPLEDDPIDFLKLCTEGKISQDDFDRHGSAMAMRYVLAEEKKGAADRKRVKEEICMAQEAEMEKRKAAAHKFDAAKKAAEADSNEVHHMDISDDEEEEGGERIDVDGDLAHFHEGFDLTKAPWNAKWMQDLLAIDTSSAGNPSFRPESSRINWIEPNAAMATFFNADAMSAVMASLNLNKA